MTLSAGTAVALSTFPGVILFAFTLIRTGRRAVIRNIAARGLRARTKKRYGVLEDRRNGKVAGDIGHLGDVRDLRGAVHPRRDARAGQARARRRTHVRGIARIGERRADRVKRVNGRVRRSVPDRATPILRLAQWQDACTARRDAAARLTRVSMLMKRFELRAVVAGRDELVVQSAKPAVRHARAERGTEHCETRNALLQRIPILSAIPAARAARRARFFARLRRAVDADSATHHEPCPRLFQYGANTCADSA